MLDLESAIKHCEEVANEMTAQGDCEECAKDHRQLAEWLKELKQLREQHPSEDCISRQAVLDGIEELKKSPWCTNKRGNGAERLIIEALEVVANLCVKKEPQVIPRLKAERWIPCDKMLPEDDTLVLVTIQVGSREPVVRSGYYFRDGHFQIDNGDCWNASDKELKAWMPLPPSYQGE